MIGVVCDPEEAAKFRLAEDWTDEQDVFYTDPRHYFCFAQVLTEDGLVEVFFLELCDFWDFMGFGVRTNWNL